MNLAWLRDEARTRRRGRLRYSRNATGMQGFALSLATCFW
jgi:hypothetical protein